MSQIVAKHAGVPDELAAAPSRPATGWLRAVDTGDRIIARVADVVLAIALLGDLGVVLGNVILRQFFGTSFLWIDEVSRLALVTMTFLGGAVAYRLGMIPSLQIVVNLLPAKARRVQLAFAHWVVVGTAGTSLWVSIPHVQQQWALRTSILHFPVGLASLALTVGMGLFVVFGLAMLARQPLRTVAVVGIVLACLVSVLLATRQFWVPTDSTELLLMVVAGGAVLLAAGVPLAFVLALSALMYLVVPGELPLDAFVTNLESGVQSFLLLAVPFFILAGLIMDVGGISTRIIAFARTLVGHVRGGLLQVQVVTMYLFSGISGSESADISAVGSAMAKSMRQMNYPRGETSAVLASSASMGITVPPSIASLILASVSSISVSALFAAGLLPAVVLAIALMAVIGIRARRLGFPSEPRSSARHVASTGLKVIPAMGMMVLLLGGIVGGVATPTEVSTFAVAYGVAISLVLYRSLTLKNAWTAVTQTTALVGMVLMLVSAAHAFAWMLTVNEVPQKLGEAITSVPGGTLPFLAVTIILVMLLGALFEGIPALLILAPILLPTALELGIDPVHYGVILIFSMGIGAFSPPIGVGFLLACAVNGATLEESVKPYLSYFMALLVGTVVLAAVPWFTLVVPRLLGV